MATDGLLSLGPEVPALVWLNSPSNPTGRVLPVEHLRKVVDWCRQRGTLLVSDECYVECAWDAEPVSVLHPDVCGGSTEGLLAVHSLSKRSNLAGYRCAFVAGDAAVVAELLAVRKNLGLQMPGPQQRAMVAALDDDEHVAEQHERYAARRAVLRRALEACRLRDHPLRGVALPLGHARRGAAGTPSPGSPSAASSSRPARSTAPPAGSTCGWRSPPPTSGSRRRCTGCRPSRRPRAATTRRGQSPMPALRWSITGPCASCGLNRMTFASFSTRTLWPAGQWKTSPPEQRSSAPSV